MTSTPANPVPDFTFPADVSPTSHGAAWDQLYTMMRSVPSPTSLSFTDALSQPKQSPSGSQLEYTRFSSPHFTGELPNRKRKRSGDFAHPEAGTSVRQTPYSDEPSLFPAYIDVSPKKMKLGEQSLTPLSIYPPAQKGTVDVFGNAHEFTVNGGTFNISHTSTTHFLPPAPESKFVADISESSSKRPNPSFPPSHPHASSEQGPAFTDHPTSDSISPPPDAPIWTESEVYARLLIPKGHGYPLWIPEPYEGVSPEYQLDGIRIGDVGIVNNDGGFQFLFNVCHSSQSPINRDGVPDEFLPFPSRDLNILQQSTIFDRGTHIMSAHIRKRTVSEIPSARYHSIVSFESSRSEGAILGLPEGGSRTNAQNLAKLRQYAIQNARGWYRYANGQRGWEIQNDALYLVTGCDKCTCWAMASFSNGSSEETLELATVLENSEREDGVETLRPVWKEINSTAAVRTGPHQTPANSIRTRPNNQCVFVRGYKIAIAQDTNDGTAEDTSLIPVVNSSSEHLFGKGTHIPYGLDSGYYSSTSADTGSTSSSNPSNPSGSQRSNGQPVTLLQFPESRAIFHPSDIINHFLLSQNHFTKVAITHDDDWCSVINENESSCPSEKELLHRILDQFSIQYSHDGPGVVPGAFLHPRHSLSHQILDEDVPSWSDFLNEPLFNDPKGNDHISEIYGSLAACQVPDSDTPDLTPDLYPLSSLVSPYDASPSVDAAYLRTPEHYPQISSLAEFQSAVKDVNERENLTNQDNAFSEDLFS